MPRDGSGNYRQPHPPVEEDTTIESAVYNDFTADVSIDLNWPRPITAGGTGAANIRDAAINLSYETAKQLVVNYGSHPWLPGSFYSLGVVNDGAPVSGHKFVGACYMSADGFVLEARDQTDTAVPGKVYVKEKKPGGNWSAWTIAADDKLDETGGTMTGTLIIQNGNPTFVLDRTGTTGAVNIVGSVDGKARWTLQLNDGAAESATDLVGSNFNIIRHRNDGTPVDQTLHVDRLDGIAKINGHERVSRDGDSMLGPLVLPAAWPTLPTHAANMDYVDKAPRRVYGFTTSYVFVLGDAGALIYMMSSAEAWFHIPQNANVPFPSGTQIDLVSWTGSIVRVNPLSGVTLQSEDNRRRLRGAYATATLVKIGAADQWLLTGSLIP